jgi:tetratricopeptide (TPR) repeat protein
MKQSAIFWIVVGSLATAGCARMNVVTPVADAREPVAKETAAIGTGSTGSQADESPSLPKDVLYQLLIGEIAGQRGQLDVSVASLSEAARATRDPQLAERATLVALYARQTDAALPNARLWVELQPDNTEAREALGLCLVEAGDATGAVAEFEELFKRVRGGEATANAAVRVATAVGRAQKRDAALAVMGTLVERHRNRAELHFAQAHLAVRVGDLDLADRASAEALRLRPDWEDAAVFRSRVLVSRKETQQALDFNEAFLAKHRDAVGFRTNHARYLVELRQWDRAREQFKRAADASPNDADILYAVGLLALQTGQPDEAEEYLARALAERPENDQARLYLGQLAFERRDYPKAATWYRGVSAESDVYLESRTRLALVTARQGNVEEARLQLAALLPETDAERVQVALAEEQMLREAHKHQEAMEVLNRYIKAMPENNDLLYARSLLAEHLNDLVLHERDLRSVIERDPKNAHALNALGYTLADRTTRFDEARDLLERALELKPDDPYIMDSVGWVYYRLGRYDDAVKYLRAAIEKRPDAEISAHLGEVLWVMGDHATAESVWSQALQATPDSEVLLGIIKKFKP